jgi:hypothetical protein
VRIIRSVILAAVWASTAVAQTSPSQAEQLQIIEQARGVALQYSADLPNFICTETIVRSGMDKKSQAWKTADKLTLDLAYSSQKGESYKLLTINDKPTRKTFNQVGGVSSSGDFGTILEWVFRPKSETTFKWEQSADVNGRTVYVFSYRVEKARSDYKMTWNSNRKSANPGFEGLVYIDKETHRVLRVAYRPDAIPADWSLASLSSELSYGYAEINGQRFLLPLHAEMLVGMKDGTQLRNVMDFATYRKFSSDLILNFQP